MRKIIISLGLLAAGVAYAQTGKVGVNTSSPEATLDINPTTANAAATATTNEGILIPRLSRERIENISATDLRESTLVYVNDTTEPIGGVSTTENVTTKGFYYYDADTGVWLKVLGSEDVDLRIVGNSNHITKDAGIGGTGTAAGAGANNIGIGKDALLANTNGNANIAVGASSGRWITRGNGNIHIGGANRGNNSPQLDNVVAIGNGFNQTNLTTVTSMDNVILLGNAVDNPKIGIGTYKPSEKVHVKGNVLTEEGGFYSSVSGWHGGKVELLNPSKTVSGTSDRWVMYNNTGDYANGLQFWNYKVGSGSEQVVMFLSDEGNVGVGDFRTYAQIPAFADRTPQHKLHVLGNVVAEGGLLRTSLASEEGGYLSIVNSGKTTVTGGAREWRIYNMRGSYSNSLQFWGYDANGNNLGPKFTIADNGNVGIGTGAPSQKLEVAGQVLASNFTLSSDSRLKEHVKNIDNASKTLSQLRPVTYHWNTKGKQKGGNAKLQYGFIAQEVEKVLPDIVEIDKSSDKYKSVNYTAIVPVLVKAIQEKDKEIEELKVRLDAIEKKIGK